MNKLICTILVIAALGLSGCGSFLATMQSDTIEDDLGERTLGQQLDDENIETKAVVNIHASDTDFDDAHLVIISYNGYVLVAGQVQSEALKAKATLVVREIRDVRRIYTNLKTRLPAQQ